LQQKLTSKFEAPQSGKPKSNRMNTSNTAIPEKTIALLKTTAINLCDEEVRDQQYYKASDWIQEICEKYGWRLSAQLAVLEDTNEAYWDSYFDNAKFNDTTYGKVIYASNGIAFDIFDEDALKKHFYKYSGDANYTGNGVVSYYTIARKALKEFVIEYLPDIYVVLCHCPSENA
jgi:hypothetical protein